METVDATIVFLPRFTTLVGPGEFFTLPLDVSRYAGAQFQVFLGGLSNGSFTVYLEESLDADTWVLGPATPEGVVLGAGETRFFSYGFRLRWFRLKVKLLGGTDSLATCWAEGLLRGGGGGVWALPKRETPAGSGPTATAAGAAAARTGESVAPPQPAAPWDRFAGGKSSPMPDMLSTGKALSPQEMMAFALEKLAQAGKK
ncbi:MAG: hypothetical protein L6R43_05080 [Planctomycetes bacterium]|nr:hypothetical protein [Planctomycetota bacterium]